MKRLVVAGAAVISLVAGGATLSPAADAAGSTGSATVPGTTGSAGVGYQPPPILWGTCASARLQRAGAQCGFLTVPLDYQHPSGTKIKLAVSRVKHTTSDANYQGVMLVNPGGPGGSGLIYSVLQGAIPNGAGDSYDWIGFDPRGVGSSEPSLSCNGAYAGYDRPLYEPVTPKLEKAWLGLAKGYAKDCTAAGGALLNHVKTTDSAQDMDSIRKALGRQQINYYGFSYGTYLGQVYASLYPNRIRRAVFDGVVNPTRVWYAANKDQDVAFNISIKIFFTWVAQYDSVYHLGTTEKQVERAYYTARAKLVKDPAGGLIGPDEWTDVFTSAAYYVYGWEDVATAFASWVNDRDPAPVTALYPAPGTDHDGTDNNYAMYLATQCTDTQWPTSWPFWRRDNWRTFATSPFLTWSNAWYNAPCINWSGKVGRPVTVNGAKVAKILMINETYDAATPYSGALTVRKLFPKSVLIEGVGGSTHAGSLSGVTCTDDTIAGYLANGTLPARVAGNTSDKKCPPVPQPDPTAAAAARTPVTGSAMSSDLRAGIGNRPRVTR